MLSEVHSISRLSAKHVQYIEWFNLHMPIPVFDADSAYCNICVGWLIVSDSTINCFVTSVYSVDEAKMLCLCIRRYDAFELYDVARGIIYT